MKMFRKASFPSTFPPLTEEYIRNRNLLQRIDQLIEEIEQLKLLQESLPDESSGQTCGPTFFPEPSLAIIKKVTNAGTRVVYKRKIRRITLQRLLLSRIVWKIEEVTFDEILVIYDNLLNLMELSEKDPSFREKYGSTLEVLAKFLKSLNLQNSEPKNLAEILYRQFRLPIYASFIIPRRNLSTVEKHMCNSYRLLPTLQNPGIPTKALPPKRWIGIGYRDKGSARNSAIDGNPSWQEVAMSTRIFQKGKYIYGEIHN